MAQTSIALHFRIKVGLVAIAVFVSFAIAASIIQTSKCLCIITLLTNNKKKSRYLVLQCWKIMIIIYKENQLTSRLL